MINYNEFHQVFPAELQSPYDRQLQNDIDSHRKELDGILFVDRVLKALGITKGNLVCPKRPLGLSHVLTLLSSQNISPQDRRSTKAIPPARLRSQHCDSP